MNAGEREGLRRLAEAERDVHPTPWREQREGQWEWSCRDADGDDLGWTGAGFRVAANPAAVIDLLDALEAVEAERDDLRDLMQRQNLMIATTEIRAEETERKVAAVEALPETSGWIAYDGVKDRSVIYVDDLRAALAAEETAELPPRTHETGPRSDLGPESGQRDHRDDEGRSGAQDGNGS